MQVNSVIWAKDNGISLREHIKHLLIVYEEIECRIPKELREPVKYAILLHDLGKVLPYFQIVSLGNKEYKPFNISIDMNIYHSLASVLFIDKNELGKIIEDKNIRNFVLSAVAYHHWKSTLEEDMLYSQEKFKKLLEYSQKDILIENLKKELNGLLGDSVISFDEDMTRGLANGLSFIDYVTPPYKLDWLPIRLNIRGEKEKNNWILISGFLQRCDHYASFCEKGYESFNEEDLEKVEIGNIEYDLILKNIKKAISNKTGKNTQEIKLWQEEKLEEIATNNIILIAPTGSGKTEFAFLWSGSNKLIYTLPLRSASEQIFDRAREIFVTDKVGILHGDADVYILRKDLETETNEEIDKIQEQNEKFKIYQVSKNLSYPVIIATGDQFFPYALRPPLYERIYATLSYSNLVIDEVQAYDPVACAIVVKFIEDIVKLGGKFLLMTATLPEYVKKEIEKRTNQNSITIINLYEKEREKYENLKKHKLKLRLIDNSSDFVIPDEYINEIIQKAQKGERVLVILNTIKQAENVYERIKKKANIEKENIILFHSRFTFNEKQKIKNKIEKLFKNPKDDSDNEGKILVSTQVVEASIDIDADVLYTEICPLDALVQRMGRVLRRYKENYQYESEENVHVLIFKKGYESGNGRVYDEELIKKAIVLLANYNDYISYHMETEEYGKYTKDSYNTFFTNREEKGKKSKDRNNNKIENLWKKTNEMGETLMSEYGKYRIVREFYAGLDSEGEYLSRFENTLSILDAGYMSEKRSEAQDIFRRIVNIPVVYEEDKEKFKKKLKELIKSNNFNYTDFKDKIIAEFVVQIPHYELKEYIQLSEWIREVEEEYKNYNQTKKRFNKLKEWCDGVFIAKKEGKDYKNVGNII